MQLASVGGSGMGAVEIAFPEMQSNLVKRALFPLLGLRQPENLALGIQRRPLSADRFEPANLDELFHELHSCGVKPTNP